MRRSLPRCRRGRGALTTRARRGPPRRPGRRPPRAAPPGTRAARGDRPRRPAVRRSGQSHHAGAAEVLGGDQAGQEGDGVTGAHQVHLQQRVGGGEADPGLDAGLPQVGARPDSGAGARGVQRPRSIRQLGEVPDRGPGPGIRQHQQQGVLQQRLAVGAAPHHLLPAGVVLAEDHVVAVGEQPVVGIVDLLLCHLQVQVRVLLREHADRGGGEGDHRGLEGGHPQQPARLPLCEGELGLRRLQQPQHLLGAASQLHPGVREHHPPAHLLEQGDLRLPFQLRELLGDRRRRHRMGARDRRHRLQPAQFVQQEQTVQVQHGDLLRS